MLNFVRALLDEARIWLNLDLAWFPLEIFISVLLIWVSFVASEFLRLAALHLDLLDGLLRLGLFRQRHFEDAVLEAGLDLVRIDRVGNPD